MRHAFAPATRRFTLIAFSTVATALLGLASAAHARTDLLVYSALEADQIKAYKAAFEKAHPDIELKFVRDSTGIITARLLAEKDNPRADVVWSGFSQGGIMAGNMGSDSSHGYNTVGIVTNGSPIDHFDIPSHIPVLQVQHALDPVPVLDGSYTPNQGPNVDWVYGNVVTADGVGFAPHNAGTYTDTLQGYIDQGGQFQNDWSFLNGSIEETYVGHTGEGNHTQPTRK